VTREYGRVTVLDTAVEAKESDTVMRVLEANADITTRYGGGFVSSIDGVAEAQRGGHPYDWFYYVDGTEVPVGAADTRVHAGERIWWDYRDWSATAHVPAVVGSWPAPFSGYEGRKPLVAVRCEGGGGACATVRAALRREGATLAEGSPSGALRVLVGPWARLRRDPVAATIEAGPAESGVFAEFTRNLGDYSLRGLEENGEPATGFGPGAGLVAATSRLGGLPVWVVTGGTAEAVRAAAGALEAAKLRDHYAVAVQGGKAIPLPVAAR
jgi:hypothetical protein